MQEKQIQRRRIPNPKSSPNIIIFQNPLIILRLAHRLPRHKLRSFHPRHRHRFQLTAIKQRPNIETTVIRLHNNT